MSRRAYISQADNDRSAPLRPFVCELHLAWRRRVVIAGLAIVAAWAWVLWTRPAAGATFAAVVTVVIGAYAAWTVARSRAWLEVTTDYRLRTRRFGSWRTIDGEQVRRVDEVMAGRSPDIRLVLGDGSVVVPTSLLRAGHRILFVWLAATAPQASYDDRAARIRQRLADDGWPVGVSATSTDARA